MTLKQSIERVFRNWNSYHNMVYQNANIKYFLTFPVQEKFEMPVIALDTFFSVIRSVGSPDDMPDAIAIMVNDNYIRQYYSTLDANIKNELNNCSAVPLNIDGNYYYILCGMIFDHDWKPMLCCSWEVSMCNSPSNDRQCTFLRPIVRISPSCFHKSNKMEKYIVDKIIKAVLFDFYCSVPYIRNITNYNNVLTASLKVDDDFPFKMESVDTPSISDSQKDILKVVIDNINDIII